MLNPIKRLIAWASTVLSYPSSPVEPWSSTPTQVTPAYSYFTPGPNGAPTAQEMNAILNQRDSAIASLQGWSATNDGENFGALIALSTIASGSGRAVQWSRAVNGWVGVDGSTGITAYFAPDGATWAQLGTASLFNRSNLGAPFLTTAAGVLIAFEADGSAHVGTQTYNPTTNAWASFVNGPSGFNFNTINGNAVRNFNGGIVWTQAQPTSGAAKFSWSANAGATWTNTSSSIPANFGATGNGIALILAVGSTVMCAFPAVTNATQYLVTTDGQNWSQVSITLLTGETPVGADYDSVNGLFYLAVTTSTACRILSATPGNAQAGTWTVAATLSYPAPTNTTIAMGGYGVLAANGGELALLLKVTGIYRIALSVDGAGATWGCAKSPPLAAPSFLQGPNAGGGTGFIYQDGTNYSLTHQAGTPDSLV